MDYIPGQGRARYLFLGQQVQEPAKPELNLLHDGVPKLRKTRGLDVGSAAVSMCPKCNVRKPAVPKATVAASRLQQPLLELLSVFLVSLKNVEHSKIPM